LELWYMNCWLKVFHLFFLSPPPSISSMIPSPPPSISPAIPSQVGCQVVAVLLHYFFLVTFMWMLMEGVVLYVALVRVFVKHTTRYIIAFTAISYGELPPLVPTLDFVLWLRRSISPKLQEGGWV